MEFTAVSVSKNPAIAGFFDTEILAAGDDDADNFFCARHFQNLGALFHRGARGINIIN